MTAKDIYHDTVKNALIKSGWHITHDPLVLKWGSKDLYVDLGAERLLAAEKSGQKIAVEVKSFVSQSEVDDLKTLSGSSSSITMSCFKSSPTVFCILPSEKRYLKMYSRNQSAVSC
jgi:hypothetical protein